MNHIGDLDQALLDYLSRNSGFVNASEVARALGTSTKTIYRHIDQINERSDEPVIQMIRGKGARLLPSALPDLKASNEAVDGTNQSSLERRNQILEQLLFRAPLKISLTDLYADQYVSDATIDNDLLYLKRRLLKQKLHLVRVNNTVHLEGEETDIREQLSSVLQNMSAITNGGKIEGITDYDQQFITTQVQVIEQATGGKLAYPYNVNILSHLYILIQRVRRQGKAEQLKIVNSGEVRKLMLKNLHLYRLAEIVINNTEKYLAKKLPPEETDYLFQYLISSRIDDGAPNVKMLSYSQKVLDVSQFLIRYVNEHLPVAHIQLKAWRELAGHVAPLINRLENNIAVTNGLLADIKREYAKLFEVLTAGTQAAAKEFQLPEISANEVGFIVMYFARFLEQQDHKIQTLVICASGIGTSELLRVKLEKTFRELKIDQTATGLLSDIDLNSLKNTDLIVSTIDLKGSQYDKLAIPKVLVSAVLSNLDKEKIRHAIKEIK
ncbi:transcriptional antiterminator [Lacticaseibacillus chiayiensis]|uniref:PRD domain-containing protein n=1 Tax=Lacticaseibacillus chiayiensis TaxID=2100821 RepID=A0A4V1P3E3_9LACO|nr:PRD domain-containing protein [Lacticaseibacillus chiayiensis]RXT30720.1 transcriptional antiterminator [Lacticaseibacillus chiayiensis]UYN56322.1 PRD domain-containing protein [Lacticaseibacillus chiayiensis]